MNNINESLQLMDKLKFRLVYSFFISDIKSFNDHISYIIHFLCLNECLNWININGEPLFDECIFIIQSANQNSVLINELKNKLSIYTFNIKKISFIIEDNNPYEREGGIFKTYIIDKLDEYDGLTLFFHNKGLNKDYGSTIDDWSLYWIIGEYYYLMRHIKEYFGEFIRSNKLIYGWPYMHDNYHSHWLIGGNCFWMKCQEIQKYIYENNLQTNYISTKCISEFYFPEIFTKELIDYPNSNVIKDYTIQEYYEPSINSKFGEYLKRITPYNDYIQFKEFYDYIVNKYNEYIENNSNII